MKPDAVNQPQPVGRAAFLGGLLAFVVPIEFSVVGIGHARTLQGAANMQYWVVVALVAAAAGFVTYSLGRAAAASRFGEVARWVAVALSAVLLALFVWETVALGTGAFPGPLELARSAIAGRG